MVGNDVVRIQPAAAVIIELLLCQVGSRHLYIGGSSLDLGLIR